MLKTLSITLVLVCFIVSSSITAVPQLINYQGLLIDDTTGTPLNGTYDITFALYSVDIAGSPYWTETHSGVIVEDGLFAVILGSITPFGGFKSTQHDSWIGVTFGTDPEQSPRSQLISVPFAFEADRADEADTASFARQSGSSVTADTASFAFNSRFSDTADYAGRALFADTSDYADNSFRADIAEVANNVINNSIGSAQLIDNNVTSQDIADSTVIGVDIAKNTIKGTHLTLGAVNSEKIADGTILEADLSFDPATQSELNTHQSNAPAHHTKTTDATELTSGTVDDSRLSSNVPLANTTNTFTDTNTFSGTVKIGDSTFQADNNGIRIGKLGAPFFSFALVDVRRRHHTPSEIYGIYVDNQNTSTGRVYGIFSRAFAPVYGTGGTAYGVRGVGVSDDELRFGIYGQAIPNDLNLTTGSSYGVYGIGTRGATAYGVYGLADFATTNWAGYFLGNVNVTGTLSKGGGSFRIDHPLDPENKYLQHSFVESPDMMNVYNGNVVLDANGDATVNMPDYFEVLNKDFRYQLTAIGAPGPNLYIADKISSNQFSIAGGDPYSEVSWQVTGVRQDKWAEKNRIQVELDKPAKELGFDMHY
ncbi:MAG: hypothetical protein IH931_07215, partial [candidate division Zixibacteria bacterium]|nr:hypothetical protein [candidate division Zixibacteria bacterium]